MLKKLRHLYQDTLLQNSFYLMLTTGVMAVLGFAFWFVCARLFSPDEIGIATSLISAMSLISYAGLLGFNNTFVRILPTSSNKNGVINTGLLLSVGAAVVLASGYVLLLEFISPKLDIILDKPWYSIVFVVMVALATINLLTDSIFIAFRGARFNLLIDGGIMGVTKLFLPLAFVSLGSYGVFLASGSAASVALLASIIFLIVKFDYRPALSIHIQTLRNVFHYSFVNYIANLFNIAPTLILPLIVLNHLGAANAGFYYLSFTVANLLYAVVYSVSSSLFAEGSYGEVGLKKLFTRSAIIVSAIAVPSGLILALFGPAALSVFGKSYSDVASHALTILALAVPAVAAYTLGLVYLRITHRVYAVVTVNIIYMVTISGLALLWVNRGLSWIAIAWAVGNTVAALAIFIPLIFVHLREKIVSATI